MKARNRTGKGEYRGNPCISRSSSFRRRVCPWAHGCNKRALTEFCGNVIVSFPLGVSSPKSRSHMAAPACVPGCHTASKASEFSTVSLIAMGLPVKSRVITFLPALRNRAIILFWSPAGEISLLEFASPDSHKRSPMQAITVSHPETALLSSSELRE